MTLNQLLTAIAKAGHSVSIEFDDGALMNHGYPFYVGVNGYSLINILSEYQEEIEQSLLNKAEGSGGSFEYEYDKELNYSLREDLYNYADKEHYEGTTIRINHDPNYAEQYKIKPTKSKFPYEAFPESFITTKAEETITLSDFEGEFDDRVIPFLIKKFKKELKRVGYFEASFFAEGDKYEDGDFSIHYSEEETDHAYNIVKGNGIEFFESVEFDELSEKEIEGLSKALEMTTEEFNNFLTTIEIDDE